MELEEITFVLQEHAQTIAHGCGATQWYLFGSVSKHDPLPKDVDLLIVCSKPSDPAAIRLALQTLGNLMPLHLLFLTPDEEQQLQFVRDQKAQRIFP